MSTIIEVRPDHGGKDAENFAQELLESIENSLIKNKYNVNVIPMSDVARSFVMKTNAKAKSLQWLEGSHVITRIPKGASARHTSEATVVIRDEKDFPGLQVHIDDKDIRVDRYRGHGAGGQKKNKTSSAVRVTHLPTGIIVTRETGRSQSANLDDAMEDLRSRLEERQRAVQVKKIAHSRSVLTDKVRSFTHNHQRDEVLCHASGERWRFKEWLNGRWTPTK